MSKGRWIVVAGMLLIAAFLLALPSLFAGEPADNVDPIRIGPQGNDGKARSDRTEPQPDRSDPRMESAETPPGEDPPAPTPAPAPAPPPAAAPPVSDRPPVGEEGDEDDEGADDGDD